MIEQKMKCKLDYSAMSKQLREYKEACENSVATNERLIAKYSVNGVFDASERRSKRKLSREAVRLWATIEAIDFAFRTIDDHISEKTYE